MPAIVPAAQRRRDSSGRPTGSIVSGASRKRARALSVVFAIAHFLQQATSRACALAVSSLSDYASVRLNAQLVFDPAEAILNASQPLEELLVVFFQPLYTPP
jgi:hypothetical protein